MKNLLCGLSVCLVAFMVTGCSTPPIVTVVLHEDPNRVVRLQTTTEGQNPGGYAHPVILSGESMERILKGLVIEEYKSAVPLLGGSSPSARHPAFHDEEVSFFAPLLAKGLSQATPEEVVTFFQTVDISPRQRGITSGAVYVEGEQLHVLLSNYRVKVSTWQDNESYNAPYRMQPLKSIHPEPIRLLFHLFQYMGVIQRSGLASLFEGNQPEVAILFTHLPADPPQEAPEGQSTDAGPLPLK